MKSETHFNVDNIDNIRVFPIKELNYKWYEYSRVPKTWFWGSLNVGVSIWKPGWCNSGGFRGYFCDHSYEYVDNRRTTNFLIGRDFFWIGDDKHNGSWYERAKVIVNKIKGDQIVNFFKTDAEAKKWVEGLKSKTNTKFEVIYND